MRWSSTLSEKLATVDAVAEAAAATDAGLGGARADLVVVFASSTHTFGEIPRRLRDRFPHARILGCSAGGVIGGGREAEGRPALSVTAASLPAVDLRSLHVRDGGELPTLEGSPHFVLLADPFTCDIEGLVGALDEAYPEARKVGGLASGGGTPGSTALFLDDETLDEGAVGMALGGDLAVDTVVAQGCRPIGQPLIITRCERHVVQELGGRTPVVVLRELHESLSQRDRALFRSALHVGIEMTDRQVEYRAGDFLIRNVLGVDPESGALAVGARPRRFQALQFHLRDAASATEDLLACLERRRVETGGVRPAGALLFSCLGRGERFFGRPNHDSDLFRERVGPVPLGGFFCNGEIGPVGPQTFLHGYTSSFALFRPAAT